MNIPFATWASCSHIAVQYLRTLSFGLHLIDQRHQHPPFCDCKNQSLCESQRGQLPCLQKGAEDTICCVGFPLASSSSSWSPLFLNGLWTPSWQHCCPPNRKCRSCNHCHSDREYKTSFHQLQQSTWVANLSLPGQPQHIKYCNPISSTTLGKGK